MRKYLSYKIKKKKWSFFRVRAYEITFRYLSEKGETITITAEVNDAWISEVVPFMKLSIEHDQWISDAIFY